MTKDLIDERIQGRPRMYLAHHELESNLINVIIVTVVVIYYYYFYYYCYYYFYYCY